MRTSHLALGLSIAFAAPITAAGAQAMWSPGAELVGHSAQVVTNGVTNTVYFDPGGSARLVTPSGTTVQGTWSAANGNLCLNTATGQECWPYTAPFQAGRQITLTSSCQAVSTWTALSTNPPPQQAPLGERG